MALLAATAREVVPAQLMPGTDSPPLTLHGRPYLTTPRDVTCRSGGVPSAVLGAAKEAPVMAIGTVKWFDPNRGYGFIRTEQGEDVFVYSSAVQASGLQSLQDGQAVEFDLQLGPKGP